MSTQSTLKHFLVRIKSDTRLPWLYLILAYGWAWLWTIPIALTRRDYQTSVLLLVATFIAIFGPGLAAIVLTYRTEDRQARADYWYRAFDVRRIHVRWIVFMLILWPGLHLLANILSKALGSEVPVSDMVRSISDQPLFALAVVTLYFLQSLLEDLGWRGYMLEKVLKEWTPFKAALIVGVFHAFWHLPFFFIIGTNQMKIGLGFNFWLFIAQAVAFSVFATWCYVDNHHSTMAAILLHTVGNLSNDIFNYQAGTPKFWLYTLFMVVGAIIVGIVWLRRKGGTEYVQQVIHYA
jgi:membrane protease YdiL (CAAX protease family)